MLIITTMSKEVITFAVDPATKKELQGMEKYTLFIGAVVAKAMGRCPVCNGPWPHGEENERRKPDK
jgi:hypothetical protein